MGIEARLIWTMSEVTLIETSRAEVRGIGPHGIL